MSKSIELKLKDWESSFFNKKYYALVFKEHLNEVDCSHALKQMLSSEDFDLIECNLDLCHIKMAKVLEKYHFQLVDSRITFVTKINRAEGAFDHPNTYKEYNIRYAMATDLPVIVEMTHRFLTWNSNFVSRYKDLDFFDEKDAERYFETWINYSINSKNAHTAVLEFESEVVGFFIFEQKEDYKETPLYKGILCAIEKAHQGKKLHLALQSFLFNDFVSNEFYLDNTTQLSNYAVVKNHIRSDRNLSKMSLTFLLSKQES